MIDARVQNDLPMETKTSCLQLNVQREAIHADSCNRNANVWNKEL